MIQADMSGTGSRTGHRSTRRRHGSAWLLGSIALIGAASMPYELLAAGTCTAYGAGSQVGTASSTVIDESSGLAASVLNAGIYWTLNDSGNSADLYAFTPDGTLRSTFGVGGANNIDWEDLAVGPCPSSCSCLFIADIGDNLEARATRTIYRVPEPLVGIDVGQTEDAEALTFDYPDGRHDAETILVDPNTGDIYIVTKKSDGVSGVYRFPSPDPSDLPVTLEKVGSITFTGGSVTTTGGSVTADGGRVVIRTYGNALEWDVPAGQPLHDAFLSTPRQVTLPSSGGGEAIAYAVDGMSIVTTSEGAPMPILQTPCTTGTPVTQVAFGLETQCPPSSGGCSTRIPDPTVRTGWGFSLLGLGLIARRRRARV